MIINLFGSDDGKANEIGTVEIGFMHVDSGNLMIVIGSVVTDALIEIVARRVDGDFVFVVAEVAATTLLVDGMENVEELADTRELVVGGEGMGAGESGFDETGIRR